MSRYRSTRAGPLRFKRPSLTDKLGFRIGAVFVAAALPLTTLLGFWAPHDRGYTLIGLATALGVFIAVAGLEKLVAAPLRRLGTGIDQWRSGNGFDLGEIGGLPHEFRSVALSFKKATLALNRREADLVKAVQRQDLAMQEIHHRVKNNLQVVASLLNLQASRIRLPEAKSEFQSARDRVRALATVHRHLYAHGEINTINMRVFLADLCGPLLLAMGQGGDERIRLDIDAPELQMTSDQAVPLSLIVTEAVTNAIKYGFPDGRAGTISIKLTAAGDDVELDI
ncbi:MAG: sensor histidine kinase, partial [Acetobacteraceae bacterium]|nr:sensor histidine kinase [Acetobacteraceae bacterium]